MQKMLTTIVQLTKNRYIEKETGYMICENATLGSTGMQEYYAAQLSAYLDMENLAPNTKIKVYRPAEEVFKPESLASLENKAFTLYHPEETVTSENDSMLRKGSVYNVRRVGETIVGDIQITDQDTINKVKHIKCLSLGYDLYLEPMEGAENSFIARNIKYNHLALVPKGRSKVAQINDSDNDDNDLVEDNYMSLFKKHTQVADAEEEKVEVEVKDSEEKVDTEEKEEETVNDACMKADAEVKDSCKAQDEEEKVEVEEVKDEDNNEEEEKENDDKVKDSEEKDTDKEEKNEKVKDGGDMTLQEINALTDAEVRKVALEEYKARAMADKGLIFGDDASAFKKTVEEPKKPVMDAELERKNYYKNTLNPHKNKDWKKECVNLTDLVL